MNPRLELELLLRRHGGLRIGGVIVMAALAMALLISALAPPATAPLTVQATDGHRQLDDRHRAFQRILIPQNEVDAQQRNVLDEAANHELVPGRIDYTFENNAAGHFGIATMQMPLRGRYADFRDFIATVLAAHPALAIEDMAIQRDPAGIEAKLRLAFHTEPAEENKQ